ASGGATARTQAAAVQIGEIRSAVSQRPRRRPQHLLPPASSHLPIDPARVQSRSDGALAGCGRCGLNPDPALAPFLTNALQRDKAIWRGTDHTLGGWKVACTCPLS